MAVKAFVLNKLNVAGLLSLSVSVIVSVGVEPASSLTNIDFTIDCPLLGAV